MRKFASGFALLFLVVLFQIAVQAQTSGSLSGTITDPGTAVVPGATVTVVNNATGAERTTTTSSGGVFDFQALQPGTYTLSVETAGFKRAVARDIVVSVASRAEANIVLEIGAASEEVTVIAAQEVINSTSPSLTNTISIRQVTDLPLPTRNPLELAGLQAGVAVTGDNTRGASISGLRQTTTNVTQDGINAMDNFVKTSSLFAISTPSLNSTAEFTITTGTVGSEQGRGVGQVTLVTRGGTNEFHGSLFYMNRNDALQANSFFNNALGTPRTRQNQHFFGFDIGGPIYFPKFGNGGPFIWDGRDKAHFFFAYEGFRDNFSVTRNRTVLTPQARQGIFRYTGTNGALQTVNLLAIGNQNALNPITMGIIGTTPLPNNTDVGDGFNTAGFRYNVSGISNNDKYVGRYDHQLVQDSPLGSHKFEFVLNYFKNILSPDTFNGLEAPFPGLVSSTQGGPRWLVTGALVSNFGSNKTNTFRVGRQWAPVGFLLESSPTEPFIGFVGITLPYAGGGFQSQGRDTQVWNVKNDFSWSKGNHLIRLGGDYQRIFATTFNDTGINPRINLGTPAHNSGSIADTSFPFSTAANRASGRGTFANLVGNLSNSSATVNVTSPTSGFVPGATRTRDFLQKDLALYVQDQWRVRNNLTVNFGVRWDFMGVPSDPNGLAIQLTDHRHIFGVSGFGNLFNPNAPAGAAPAIGRLDFVSGDTGIGLYNKDWNNFAPFFGFAYSPDFKGGLGKMLFGSSGKSSLRGGYSISYLRDGFTVISNALGVGLTNPGLIASAANTTPTGVLTAAGVPLPTPVFQMPVTDRSNNLLNPNNSLWAIDPDLKTPYVQQWSFGFEREIFSNTALEVRYVANHGVKLYRAVDFNEINIFENGFLQEFLRARSNLAINAANGSPNNFGNVNPGAGTVPLPIFSSFFVGASAGNSFQNTTFISHLNNNNVASIASTLAFSNIYRAARENPANGIPANFFVANPNALAARLLGNDSMSNYNSLQVELRRRFAGGLLFQADYTFSKALTDAPDAQGNNQSTLENFRTLRDKKLDYRRSNDDQTHRFVANALYDLPFGRGRRFFSNSPGVVNQIIGGWSVGGIAAWSTRPPFFITSGRTSFNGTPIGTEAAGLPAQLLGMSFEEFRRNVGIFRTPNGIFWFNPDLLNVTINQATGRITSSTLQSGLLGQPEAGTFGNFPLNSLNSGTYFNTDISLTKRFPITETVRLELKTTFINILNNPNFLYGNTQFDSTSFGRITGTSGSPRVIHFIGTFRF